MLPRNRPATAALIEQKLSPDVLLTGANTCLQHNGGAIPLPDKRRNSVQLTITESFARSVRARLA